MAKKRVDRHKTKPFPIRLPEPLKVALEELAEKKFSTVTAEIIAAIRAHVEREGTLR